jgi:RND superfamily putative drug exporter
VVAGWVLLALTAVLINRTVDAGTVDDFEVPGVESQEAIDLLDERFPERAGATAMVVFHTEDGSVTDDEAAAGIAATVAEVQALPEVVGVTEPRASPLSISADGTTAFAAVQFDSSAADLDAEALDDLIDTAAPAEEAGVQVEYGGELPTILKERTTGPAEAIGIIAALIILSSPSAASTPPRSPWERRSSDLSSGSRWSGSSARSSTSPRSPPGSAP